jgi:hypothetical protein
MPKFLEKKLAAEYGGDKHAIYGTLNKLGALRGNRETAKGRRMERKHATDAGRGRLRALISGTK